MTAQRDLVWTADTLLQHFTQQPQGNHVTLAVDGIRPLVWQQLKNLLHDLLTAEKCFVHGGRSASVVNREGLQTVVAHSVQKSAGPVSPDPLLKGLGKVQILRTELLSGQVSPYTGDVPVALLDQVFCGHAGTPVIVIGNIDSIVQKGFVIDQHRGNAIIPEQLYLLSGDAQVVEDHTVNLTVNDHIDKMLQTLCAGSIGDDKVVTQFQAHISSTLAHIAKVGIANIRQHIGDGVGAAGDQALGQQVGTVVQGANSFHNCLTGLFLHIAVVVQHARYGHLGNIGIFCHIAYGSHANPSLYIRYYDNNI